MIRCDYCLENLSSYLDQEMSESEMREIEEHLQYCDSCAFEFNILKTIVSTCSELEEELPEGFNSSLHTRLEEAKKDILAKRNKTAKIKLFSQIAAGFLIVITLGFVVRTGIFDRRVMGNKNMATTEAAPMASGAGAAEQSPDVTNFGLMGEMAQDAGEIADTEVKVTNEGSQKQAEGDGVDQKMGEPEVHLSFSEPVSLNRTEDYDTQVTITVDDIGKAIESIMAIDEKLGESRENNMAYLEDSICAYRGTREERVELKLTYTNEDAWESFLTEMQAAFSNIQVELLPSEDELEYIRVIIEKEK